MSFVGSETNAKTSDTGRSIVMLFSALGIPLLLPLRRRGNHTLGRGRQLREEETWMRIGVLGTGIVGQTLAGKLAEIGNDVVIGTRDPQASLERTESPNPWVPPFAQWHASNPSVKVGTFAEAASHGEILVNATSGDG